MIPELFLLVAFVFGLGALTDTPRTNAPCDRAKIIRDGGFYARSCSVKYYEVRATDDR